MKRVFIQFDAQPEGTGAGNGGAKTTEQKTSGKGNAEASGQNDQVAGSKGGDVDTSKYPRTGFETSTSSGRNEKSEEESRNTTQAEYKATK